ncbi:MAG: hypothetical protein D6675_02115 [Gemmatimonadetes bacterium]|nr:MAG: hypothetical protein D6675_02115 [Gemmatimonadota bacterium]
MVYLLLTILFFGGYNLSLAVEDDIIEPEFESPDIQEIEEMGQSGYFPIEQIKKVVADDSSAHQRFHKSPPRLILSGHYSSTETWGVDAEYDYQGTAWDLFSHLFYFKTEDYSVYEQSNAEVMTGFEMPRHWHGFLLAQGEQFQRELDSPQKYRHLTGQGLVQRIYHPSMVQLSLQSGDFRITPAENLPEYQNNYAIVEANYTYLQNQRLLTAGIYYRQSNLDHVLLPQRDDLYFATFSVGLRTPFLSPQTTLSVNPIFYVTEDYAGASATRILPRLELGHTLTRNWYVQAEYHPHIQDLAFQDIYRDERPVGVNLALQYPYYRHSVGGQLKYIASSTNAITVNVRYSSIREPLVWASTVSGTENPLHPFNYPQTVDRIESESILEAVLFEFLAVRLQLHWQSDNMDLPYAPELSGQLNLRFIPRNGFEGEVAAEYVGKQFYTVEDKAQLDDYLVLHMRATQTVGAFQISLVLRNLADSDYQPYFRYTNRGISGFLRLSYTMD